ncbi:ABC transporter ATP-binding protein [Sediminibacter sp. Hel_I_10]|uniref:ABC transporter ATP-binding protein n=1 Tax=Sediminibacter sp. Hel_I_10 TaxID=1392490 RepID=UPI00047DC90A|nr:ABC transporter ATP-binding protein [Sediminibacter sp. Hel_I_10]
MLDNTSSILKTSKLAIGYTSKKGTTVVASDIHLELKKGELIGLVGANGIGKSTLLRTLATIQQPLSGSMTLRGTPLESHSAIDLAKIMSLVLTEQLMSKNLSVFELIALGRQPYTNWMGKLSAIDIGMVDQALEQTNLTELRDRKCFELSDGQLQKAMIARALAQDTDLIILDEPTTHLDMYHKAYILKLLQQLAQHTQKTILFSSHEIDLAIQLCDTMIVMTKDQVVTDAPCKLIEQGVFKSLFSKDLIDFDEKTGSFKVRK